jgi:uncharacterized protein (TIGR00645 family)
VNASVLKVKRAMAIIGISSIHLLKSFIEVGALGGLPFCDPTVLAQASELALSSKKTCTTLTHAGVMWQTIIHCVFILSAVGIAWTDRLMANGSHRERPATAH